MTKIIVNSLSTYNQTPTVTGTVEFERFDANGNPKHTIHVEINYIKYKLFDGNLGIDEKQKPNVWKLHFDYPLYPGTYDVEASVVDIATNQVIASSVNKLNIQKRQSYYAHPKPPELSLLQKFQLVNALMNSMNRFFGGQNGITPLASVHPVFDDQTSTSDFARGNDERSRHPITKNIEARAAANKAPNGKKDPHKVTSGGGGDPLSSLSPEEKEASAKLALESQGGEIDESGNIKLPAPLEELGGAGNLPTTDQVMEGLGIANEAQTPAPEGQPVYDAMGNFTGTYDTPTTEQVFNPGGQSGLGGTYENQPDETYREDGGFSPNANGADVDAALARAIATTEANKIPNIIDAYLK